MFLALNVFLLISTLFCGSCYVTKARSDTLPLTTTTTIDTKINFLHETIKLPAGIPQDDFYTIKETLNSYENVFMEIEKGVDYCKLDKQINNCTTKLENLRKNLLSEIQLLQRQKRDKPQLAFEPNFSKCFVCMNIFIDRVKTVLDDYIVHFNLVFKVDKKDGNSTPKPNDNESSTPKPNGSESNPQKPDGNESSTPTPNGNESNSQKPDGNESKPSKPNDNESKPPKPEDSESDKPSSKFFS